MEKLSLNQIISKIQQEEIFQAVLDDYSMTIKIDEYEPYVCGAVHDGHQFRPELWEYCLHTEYERWFEEDPCTKEFVNTHPIVIAGCDSRFEYDLNRAPELAIYEDAWGKQLWKKPLPQELREKSLKKHQNFYSIVHALILKLEQKFSSVVVYDMHSYNWRRWEREVPVINLGTKNVDEARFVTSIESWRAMLQTLMLPHVENTTSNINDTFMGNGYFLKFISENFKNTLVLATEFKKIYCDELNQVIFPEVVHAIENQLRYLLPKHAQEFIEAKY